MKKKKIIIISIFLALILITSFVFLKSAIDSYNYDMNPANGVDMLEGLEAIFIVIIGGSIVFYELDLFYTVYYFFINPKTKAKTALNICSNGTLIMIYAYIALSDRFMALRAFEVLPLVLFLAYIVLRIACFAVSTSHGNAEQ